MIEDLLREGGSFVIQEESSKLSLIPTEYLKSKKSEDDNGQKGSSDKEGSSDEEGSFDEDGSTFRYFHSSMYQLRDGSTDEDGSTESESDTDDDDEGSFEIVEPNEDDIKGPFDDIYNGTLKEFHSSLDEGENKKKDRNENSKRKNEVPKNHKTE